MLESADIFDYAFQAVNNVRGLYATSYATDPCDRCLEFSKKKNSARDSARGYEAIHVGVTLMNQALCDKFSLQTTLCVEWIPARVEEIQQTSFSSRAARWWF
jgi:hypothetical protein